MSNLDFDDEEWQVPEDLKGMLTTEIDFIRDVLTITDFFSGQFAKAAITMISDTNQKQAIE